MSMILRGLTWEEKALVFENLAERKRASGDRYGYEAALLSAKTMRMMAEGDLDD